MDLRIIYYLRIVVLAPAAHILKIGTTQRRLAWPLRKDDTQIHEAFHIFYLAIKRREIELFVMRWMDLESVIQSEVSQKEKNKYCMLTHIYGI